MKDRVRQVMDHFGLSQNDFAKELCVAPATISSIYRGRTAPTNNLVQSIHMAFPAININWLLFGEGDMLLPLSGETSSGTANPPIGQNGGSTTPNQGSLFDPPKASVPSLQEVKVYENPVQPTEIQLAAALSQLKKANEVDRPKRKIKEIRVFFDDGTYESFVPNSK